MKVLITEAVPLDSRGSMGTQYVMNAARAAGFDLTYVGADEPTPHGSYDVELVAVHHCTDFPRLARLPRRAPIRLAGGHPSTNNWRPAIPFADAHCIGEGEEWIVEALTILSRNGTVDDVGRDVLGTLVTKQHEPGAPMPAGRQVRPIPRHPAYLNKSGEGHARVWYLELSRGCPFKCHYCELGWMRKRAEHQDTDWLIAEINRIDKSQSNKISLFAPDEASHPGYHQVLQAIHDAGLVTSFGSMRLDQIVKQQLPIRPNMLIRVGLDGLTQETRLRVKKPIYDHDVINYFEFMSERGHANFKMFMVFGYPWENLSDFDGFERMMEAVRAIPRKVNAHLRVKFTPFIPQPSTPLGQAKPNYDPQMVNRIKQWFDRVAKPYRNPGWYIVSDGIMSQRQHALQCLLTQGDEHLLTTLGPDAWDGTSRLQGYDVFGLLDRNATTVS